MRLRYKFSESELEDLDKLQNLQLAATIIMAVFSIVALELQKTVPASSGVETYYGYTALRLVTNPVVVLLCFVVAAMQIKEWLKVRRGHSKTLQALWEEFELVDSGKLGLSGYITAKLVKPVVMFLASLINVLAELNAKSSWGHGYDDLLFMSMCGILIALVASTAMMVTYSRYQRSLGVARNRYRSMLDKILDEADEAVEG